MAITQISVFVQSKPGHLRNILNIFQQEEISVRGYSCSDTGDYGISRFIVDKPEVALEALKNAGMAVTTSDVVCLELPDEAGQLARVFATLADADINVLYSYSLISTFIALKMDEVAIAEKLLSNAGFHLLGQSELL